MALKQAGRLTRRPDPDREFEMLLRRASENVGVRRQRLLKKSRTARRAPASAA